MSLLKRLYPAKAYLSYWLDAVDEQSLHSPFLFKFYNEVLKPKSPSAPFEPIEQQRKALIKDKRLIDLQDPGAGSLVSRSQQRTVGSVAKHSLSSPAFCSFLYRLVQFQQPKCLLEIGTSLGISAAYLQQAFSGSLTTIEGSPAIAAIARDTFDHLGCQNIRLIEGKAQEVLISYIQTTPKLDLAFIDAHHSEEATLSFFDLLSGSLHQQSILVIGDIHWSAGMERAWQQLTQHESVTLSVDIFHAGILFFNPDLRKETEVLWC
ncbi:MAG: class I SAM-dependent methyltransferase [Imperialibacter sp.]|uniref:O-methyltransferase n=1 Tax=Imperialibacter sp. TaxID=2038411 RepID=UPI0032F07DE0